MNASTASPGRLAGSVSEPLPFQRLSTAETFVKTSVGTVLFLGWLLLFIFGMSLKADDYHKYVLENRHIDFGYLILYALTFTPINVAMLASLAGVLGGFASNLAANNQFRHIRPETIDPKSDEFNSYLYMTESPLVSMLRGFITYLIFIAGSYLTNFTMSGDPSDPGSFVGLTAASYFKFAVTVSLLAYLAGYDPSRMKSLVNSINLGGKAAGSGTANESQRITGHAESVKTPDGAVLNGVTIDKQTKRSAR